MDEVIGLFPTPFMRVERLLDRTLIDALLRQFRTAAKNTNAKSNLLVHTELLVPESEELLLQASKRIAPKLVAFGEHLFGEALAWSIKEMWVNILETGGHQSLHNHANSFISGVLYLTPSHPSATTVFAKSPGGSEFIFNNTNTNATMGPFNAGKFIMPEAAPGDMVLFPSYLLHEVPVNRGAQRISIAFNAIPDALDSWGYTVRFSK